MDDKDPGFGLVSLRHLWGTSAASKQDLELRGQVMAGTSTQR